MDVTKISQYKLTFFLYFFYNIFGGNMKLETLNLVCYNDSYFDILNKLKEDDVNHYVKQIDERLILGNHENEIKLGSGYFVELDSKIIGYIYFSPISNYRMYLEYSILKSERGKGYGTLLLSEATNYIFNNYNIRNINLNINKSNLASMNTALSCGYTYDECDLINNSDNIDFSQSNPFFVCKSRRH